MCVTSGVGTKELCSILCLFFPSILICLYIVFVLQLTQFGAQIVYFSKDQENEKFSYQNISQFVSEQDDRFNSDELDEDNFSQISSLDNQYVDDNGEKLLTFQKFYHAYLSYNMPLLIHNGGKHWPAFTKWQSDQYLLSKIGNKTVSIETRQDGENQFAYFLDNFSSIEMTYREFISTYQSAERKGNYYWAEKDVPPEIAQDINEPEFGLFMNLESTKIWQGSSGTESLPHTDDKDNFLCQITGKKQIVLIPPTQRDKLYITKGKETISNYSPVNFFNPDLEKYPLFAKVKGKMLVEIGPGDILFLPSFWWHHVKSSEERNIAVNFWYTPNYMHSLFQAAFEEGLS